MINPTAHRPGDCGFRRCALRHDAAMFAQRYELMDCVLSAVYLHGLAAEGCDSGILASDIAPTAAEFLQALRDSYREHFHPLRERTDPVSWED